MNLIHIYNNLFTNNLKQTTMEKNIKMSLETARSWYKLAKSASNELTNPATNFLLENFTKEELEGDEGYTWEKAFSGDGYFVSSMSVIEQALGESDNKMNKNVFKTESQAKSALAFAQLSHICAAANDKRCRVEYVYSISNVKGNLMTDEWSSYRPILFFHTKQDAETSLRVNRELWEQYHQL